jgi:hypothetical protein
MLDFIGGFLWLLMFITPLITVPLLWKYSALPKWFSVVSGLVLALAVSGVLYLVSAGIIFRNGMGPG